MNRALFRHGTSDANVWESVVDRNEYRLPDRFEPNSLVLDIGGNIGAFSYACIQRGAAKVIAFEPDPDNFSIFRKQLKNEIFNGLVEVYPVAVLGGGRRAFAEFSGVVRSDGQINHGGAFILGADGDKFGLDEFLVGRPFRVPCVPVSEVLGLWPRAALCKMDCEHSEFEIIHDMWMWKSEGNLPRQLSGEYHPYGNDTVEVLVDELNAVGYDTEIVSHPNSALGLFFASRR